MSEINIISKNPLAKKIAEGKATEDLLEMLLKKQLPFTDEEYLECLVFLLKNEDVKLEVALQLKDIPEHVKVNYISKTSANHRVAYFVLLEALNWKVQPIIVKIIRNQALPFEFLLKIAQKGILSMLEVLIENQVKLIAYPEIMDALEENPETNNFINGKIEELREFYLEKGEAEEIAADAVMEDLKESMALELEQKKKDQERDENSDDDEDENSDEDEDEDGELGDLDEQVEEKALNILQQINGMGIPDRIKLALTGDRTARMILVKDTKKMISLAVLESPKISLDEICLMARNRGLSSDIISRIAMNREWAKNYTICVELVYNPKTPIKSALGFVNRLFPKDLRMLSRDKNVTPVIRQLAFNKLAKKEKSKK